MTPPKGAVVTNVLEFIICAVYFLAEGVRVGRSQSWIRLVHNRGLRMQALELVEEAENGLDAARHGAGAMPLGVRGSGGGGEAKQGPTGGGVRHDPVTEAVPGEVLREGRLCPCVPFVPALPSATDAQSQKVATWLGVAWQALAQPGAALAVLASDVLPHGYVRVGIVVLIALPSLSIGVYAPFTAFYRGTVVWWWWMPGKGGRGGCGQ